jgi:hypothetical protein
MEQPAQIQWKYSDPTRRIRSNVVFCDMPLQGRTCARESCNRGLERFLVVE